MSLLRILVATAVGLFLTAPAFASPECERLAEEKRLTPQSKASFMRKCVADRAGDQLALCERAAARSNLRGSERNASIKRCLVETPKKT